MNQEETTLPRTLPPAVGGLNSSVALANMGETDAVILENFIAFPDRVETRSGAETHLTALGATTYGLHAYNGPSGTDKLFATTSGGVFDATSAGAAGAAVAVLTNGLTWSISIQTGAGSYMMIGNGVDSIRMFDGAAWSTPAAFGGLATADCACAEVYKQRIFFGKKSTLSLFYLGVNAIAGAATEYSLGAIFRRGGYIVALATWSVDGGSGPDDMLVIATSSGEIAVFTGSDPSSASTWTLKGVFFIGRPVGKFHSLYKYGGSVLFLSESGLFPLSAALLTASIDRTTALSRKIEQLFSDLAQTYGANDGWQIISLPNVPILLVNVGGYPGGLQLVMHSVSKAWSTFTGWVGYSFGRLGTQPYMGRADDVSKVLTGVSDFTANITATSLQAYNRFGTSSNKQIKMTRPTYIATGTFQYTLGWDSDFRNQPTSNLISSGAGTASLWGTGVWGAAFWTSSSLLNRGWRTVPDRPGVYKAFYQQIVTKAVSVAHESTDLLIAPMDVFGVNG